MVKKLEIDHNEKGEIVSPSYVDVISKINEIIDILSIGKIEDLKYVDSQSLGKVDDKKDIRDTLKRIKDWDNES